MNYRWRKRWRLKCKRMLRMYKHLIFAHSIWFLFCRHQLQLIFSIYAQANNRSTLLERIQFYNKTYFHYMERRSTSIDYNNYSLLIIIKNQYKHHYLYLILLLSLTSFRICKMKAFFWLYILFSHNNKLNYILNLNVHRMT